MSTAMTREHLLGWGSASDGQLGSSSPLSDVPLPRPISISSSSISILSGIPTQPGIDFIPGLWSTLFVTNEVACMTQPPINDSAPPSDPLEISSTVLEARGESRVKFRTAAIGREFILLLSVTGSLYAYGSGAYGELGLGSVSSVQTLTKVQHQNLQSVKIVAVAAAEFHWLALDSTGAVFSCGNNASGQLGLGHTQPVNVPTRVTALWPHPIVAISTGDGHSAALSARGHLFCFGSNKHGQLGCASFKVRVASLTPALVPLPRDSSNALMEDRKLKTNSNREQSDVMDIDNDESIQDTDEQRRTNPQQGENGQFHYVDVACGSAHTVALRNDGALICWGKGENGQLGTRSTRSMYEPTKISNNTADFPKFLSISAGERHSSALTEDGRLFMWGDGSSGQIGDGSVSDKFIPVEIPTPKIAGSSCPENEELRYLKVLCGGFHTLALVGEIKNHTQERTPFEDHKLRIPKCSVDNMLQAKAGLSRFGSATILLSTFSTSGTDDIEYLALETAYFKFLRMFGEDGKVFLRKAAAKIRRQAQVAFGLVQEKEYGVPAFSFNSDEDSPNSLIQGPRDLMHDKDYLTPKSLFIKDESMFKTAVANSSECGILFFMALMNPIYCEKSCISELAELAAVILRCEEAGRDSFLNCISICDEEILKSRVIRPLQEALSDELKGYRRITKNAIFATKMLALCYHGAWRMSKKKNLRRIAISREEFYNETVSSMVNFKEDYDRWAESQKMRPDHQQTFDDGDSQMQGDSIGLTDRSHWQNNSTTSSLDINTDTSNKSDEVWDTDFDQYAQMELTSLPPLPSVGKDEGPFAFCSYSFLLTQEAKFKILGFESQRRMSKEYRRSLLSFGAAAQSSFGNQIAQVRMPVEQFAHIQFLIIYVRRTHIVSDTYDQVANYAQNQARELRKPLRVIFHGEEGVDEGGVSKEFFQVLMEHILSPDYGMFEYDEESRLHWFRKDFLESQFAWQLIGIIFGIAAFNSILLDVHFPPVLYRKLSIVARNLQASRNDHNDDNKNSDGNSFTTQGAERTGKRKYQADLHDVCETFPLIGHSLKQLRDYEGDDVEDVFGLTYEISYPGLFDKIKSVELIANGATTNVTNQNRLDFIEKYCEFLINSSIEDAFKPFSVGFFFMLNGPFVNELTPEDLETFVTGEEVLDFSGLRQAARYEGGFTEHSPIIINLWQVLDEYDEQMKRLFLAFVTGTDRAPIGGLNKLTLVIQREGQDSTRLPTSRTCFNVLLLPDYSTRAKLRDRLTTAIRNSKGFGLE